MNKITAFTYRNITEMLRDPLSYIFCIGFPLVMLVIMTLVNESIPEQAGMTIFQMKNLSGGIAVFGQTFVMLFTALTVTKDRSGAFLVRMYATPMTSLDFCMGYILPMIVISLVQGLVTYAVSFILSLFTSTISPVGLLISIISLIPSSVLFIAFGLLFGTLFNEKSAPGLCSIIISLGSFLGCIWFDAEAAGGVMETICKSLPFIYCTKTARAAIALDFSFDSFWLPLLIITICAAVLTTISSLVFRMKMKADLA
ncbi:MAG: ABC transporter permease [Ruminococcus sp.]|nr:ABC transporter permease [Ruminococcus sp.]